MLRFSGSRLWKRVVCFPAVSKRTCSTVNAPTTADSGVQISKNTAASAEAASDDAFMKRRKKRDMYERLRFFNMGKDPIKWAKDLQEKGNNKHAVEIFEWMERNNMSFTPLERANFLLLIAKGRRSSS